jgi:hypothetical protein
MNSFLSFNFVTATPRFRKSATNELAFATSPLRLTFARMADPPQQNLIQFGDNQLGTVANLDT